MRKISMFIVSLLIGTLFAYSQGHVAGKLYVSVENRDGIPKIVVDGDVTIIKMGDPGLEELFNQHGVTAFERTIPQAEQLPKTFGLEKVYTLECTGNEVDLLAELTKYESENYNYVELVPEYILTHTPNDYNLLNGTLGENYALILINAEQAWDYTHGSANTKIGYVEFGVEENHEDLSGKVSLLHPQYGSDKIHGTFVGGILGAKTNNNLGMSSLGYDCSVVFNPINGTSLSASIIALSLDGAKSINVSMGSCSFSQTDQNAIFALQYNGTLFVASAGNGVDANGVPVDASCGNDGNGYMYPASYDGAISVSSVGPGDFHVNPFSGSIHTHNDKVDVCAPGYRVISTSLDGNGNYIYAKSSGTSFAGPYVAALGGLIYSILPDAPPTLVESLIKSTAEDIYDLNPQYTGLLGTGRIDAQAAVQTAWNIANSTSNISVYNNQDITLEGSNDIRVIDNYIHIYEGGKLTIKTSIFMKAGATITVEKGGELIIDGGEIAAYDPNQLWEGIVVKGDPNATQMIAGNQGKIRVINNGSVSNAKCAISTSQTGEGPMSFGLGGAVVVAENAVFTDNIVAISFAPYQNTHPITHEPTNDLSYIKRSSFRTTASFMEDNTPEAYIKFNAISGIAVRGCEFYNTGAVTGSNPFIQENRGKGIYSYNSNYSVSNSSSGTGGEDEVPSVFKNLYYGIYAITSNSTHIVSVSNTTFDYVKRSVYASGFSNLTVVQNNIVMPVNFWQPEPCYGVYLDECSDFMVEENYFTRYLKNEIKDPVQIGIVVNNSGPDNKMLYNNTFESLTYGINAQGINRSSTGSTGLCIKCNDFIDCDQDISVYHQDGVAEGTPNQGIAKYQGSASGVTGPAGNTFSNSHMMGTTADYFNSGASITYYHHIQGSSGIIVRPDNRSANVFISQANYPYEKPISCPSNIGIGETEMKSAMSETSTQLTQLESEITILKDGGDTQGLNTMVESSTPPEGFEVRTNLLEESPYLSETVLESAVAKESVLTNPLVKDVLVNNPQSVKSDNVMEMLNERIEPMPEEMMNEVLAGQNYTSSFENLDADFAMTQQMNRKYNSLLKHSYYSEIIESSSTEAIEELCALLMAKGTLESQYELVNLYYAQGNVTEAETVLVDIPATFTLTEEEQLQYSDYCAYFAVIKELVENNQPTIELTEAQLDIMESIYMNEQVNIGALARNMLIANEVLDYAEPIMLIDPLKSGKQQAKKTNQMVSNGLTVSPNPAKDFVVVEFTNASVESTHELVIYNAAGKRVKQVSCNGRNNATVISVGELEAGIYICNLESSGKLIASEKLIVVK